ncbi:PEGA domain-containing protein [Fervidobacterium pennivorans subsp. shakshaketiis]|uniref:PEGA domain-containing protein n=1 Tax=Fervidobacterium pennivorans TaxID=93466 RepID=UPI0014369804|nr:PEGA domain-containing protein [Fervidobacterium pennivorans]QIV78196.1 PEGA domain-containing protein [Fervidobacterium pennivorans subsp. keratinolyticus]
MRENMKLGSLLKFAFLLIALFSDLAFSLTVYAPKGSMVYYNDKFVGVVQKDSISFNAEFPGTLKVVKPGFVPFEKTLTDDATVTVELSLPSFLNLKVTPKNARVFVNGQLVEVDTFNGTARLQINSGVHEIKAEAPGYATKTLRVEINPYEEKDLEITLKRTVTLKLVSEKNIDNAILGGMLINLPSTIEVEPGKYKLYLPNIFLKSIQEIEVPFLDEYVYKVDSTQMFKLIIDGSPAGAYAWISGQIWKLPTTIVLPENSYDIRIFSQNYEDYETKVELRKDTKIFYNLKPKLEVSQRTVNNNYVIEYDGYVRDRVVVKPWFTTIKDNAGNIVWYGFSDGSLKNLPKTVPILISKDMICMVGTTIFKGPTILQVASGTNILVFDNRRAKSEERIQVEGPTVIDTEDRVLVNVYSKDVCEVYWDDEFIGNTPIYFFVTSAGKHKLTFVRNGLKVNEQIVDAKQGQLNEFRQSF